MLQNEPLDVKKLVDTAENEPLQIPKRGQNRGFTMGALTMTLSTQVGERGVTPSMKTHQTIFVSFYC